MINEVLLGLCLALVPVWTAPTPETESLTLTRPVVLLKHGSVHGQYMKVKGSDKMVSQYLGIPYAQPPIGPLRLAAPKPIEGLGVRNAVEHPVMCLQDPDSVDLVAKAMSLDFSSPGVSEDCLYLNIYSPSASYKLPVLVWIHGGGLVIGGASMYDGSPLAAYENIVVVVIQYRLGILGYFSSGDKHAPGNYGFLDQIAALQWVQQHIEHFGGDPQSVTIAGESAGGISTSLLTLSPMAKGLFHRAVFQSGVATLTDFSENPMAAAKVMANITDCGFESTELLVKCLKELTETQLINATKKNKAFLGATVDGEFLKNTAEDVLKSKDFQKVPVLLGITNHEFGWILPGAFASPGWEKGMNRQSVKAVLDMFNKAGASGANEIIMDEYLKDAKTPEDIRNAFTEMLGDIFMVLRVIKVADYHRDAGVPVYMYEFQHRPSVFKDLRPSFVKADHADDVGFVFGSCFWNGHLKIIGTPTEEENQLCKTVMGYWANFIRSGSPNGPGLVQWPLYEQSEKYMNLGLNQAEGQGLKKDKLHFFNVELPKKLFALHAA
ncbi:Fatty acyl-CoA hydrolase precursor, medium chain [Triplophysa tibetana]|uniref:Carboxylic ester hydrolase n=1 Tax=Triplophysa tibetana TaxID=1572043 RepID=A0A5A9NYW5_9TELE|nr:Fatty acyl-CoA hydrolase precursor, medium chain [Triplophysa tibetana]